MPDPGERAGARQFIESYGDGRFRISGRVYAGPVIVFPNAALDWAALDWAALDWPVTTFADLDAAVAFAAVIDRAAEIDILLVGCGPRMEMVPVWLRQACRRVSIAVDAMDTGAACRTFNLLRGEERRVAAALLPV